MTKEGFLTKEELLAEEHICNGKCQDDITKNYVHCKTCTRIKDFLAGYKTGFETCAKARLNVTTISDYPITELQLFKAKEILQTVLDKWKEERWILQSEEEVRKIENLMEQVEQFLKDSEVEV